MLEKPSPSEYSMSLEKHNPSYAELESSSNPFVVQFAQDMEERKHIILQDEKTASQLKESRLPTLKGLPISASMCLLQLVDKQTPAIMLLDRNYLANNKKIYIHKEIWNSWEENENSSPSSNRANALKQLQNRGINRENMIHAHICESTKGREIVISSDKKINEEILNQLAILLKDQYGVDYVTNMSENQQVEKNKDEPFVNKLISDYINELQDLITPKSLLKI